MAHCYFTSLRGLWWNPGKLGGRAGARRKVQQRHLVAASGSCGGPRARTELSFSGKRGPARSVVPAGGRGLLSFGYNKIGYRCHIIKRHKSQNVYLFG